MNVQDGEEGMVTAMIQPNKGPVVVSVQALHRMPYYLQYLQDCHERGDSVVAATTIALEMHLNEVQVRKDLAALSSVRGKPNSGFDIVDLIRNMEEYLGYNNTKDAVLVGAGSLGRALMSYRHFSTYGLNIVSAFDVDMEIVGSTIAGKTVRPLEEVETFCKRLQIQIGIITVPVEAAQDVCNRLVAGGIQAIWNFAPLHLSTPETILVQNENMAASLALLSRRLYEKA